MKIKFLLIFAAFFICSANGAYAQLSITPVTWNVVGLDSNRVTDGPNEFPVGVKVCNTSSSALSNLNTTFFWDSTNNNINLDVGGATQTITHSSIAANTCIDVYYTVVVSRVRAAYDTKRAYHIESSATGASTVSTPTQREIFVEHLVSQNRNNIISIVGPTTVYVGQTYNYTLNATTAPGGYEQLEAFLTLSNVIFRVLSVSTKYSQPVNATSNTLYADACGWNNNLSSPTYRSCTSSGKAGDNIETVYTVLILSAGTTTASSLIYDFSGSSYHYNSDFGATISALTITAVAGGSISGTVLNDVNGLTDSIVNGTGTNTGNPLYANLLDNNGIVLQTILVPADGTYLFGGLSAGNYTVQISINQGTVGSPAPAIALPTDWVNTGENLGAGAGSDGTVNGLLPVVIGTAAVTNANFAIEQRPVAANNTAPSQSNLGGTSSIIVPPATFSATDPALGTVTGIRITKFPGSATTMTINGTQYTSQTFPQGGVTIPTNASGNPTQQILIDPFDGAVTVNIPYVAIDNVGVESSAPATASVPFTVAPTAASGSISGRLVFGGNPLKDALVVMIDGDSNAREVVRTDATGSYLFSGKEVGRNYVIQPLSSKYSFSPLTSVVNLVENAVGVDFASSVKKYRVKNDFDGDGKTDFAVFRPSEGNWYVLRSSDAQMSVFRFGLGTDVPVSADFDGDGKTDFAVFRPSEGNWYVWQSATETLRVEKFGLANDRPIPSDFDGDGKADIAVYRAGTWFVRRSSDDSFEAKTFGLATDTLIAEDFDGDGKTDFSVYRPSEEMWFTLHNATNAFSARKFGLETDAPVAGDFDGDGFADIAQFRSGEWFVLNSTTAFEFAKLGSGKDETIVGDFNGDGRADAAVYRDGIWQIKNSGSVSVRNFNFGLPTDILIK